jgi:hypothetical protein
MTALLELGCTNSVAPTREFACQRKLDAKAKRAFLAETRRDLLAHELQGAHNFFIAEQTPAIELRQDAIEAKLAGQILEAHRLDTRYSGCRRTLDHLLSIHSLKRAAKFLDRPGRREAAARRGS